MTQKGFSATQGQKLRSVAKSKGTRPLKGGKRRQHNAIPATASDNKGYERLRSISRKYRSTATRNSRAAVVTVIDNGAQQCMVGSLHWKIVRKHDTKIRVKGAVGSQPNKILDLVDAAATLVDCYGKPIVVLIVHHALHCVTSEQSLIAEDQLEYNGVNVHSRAKQFGGRQCIIAKHPKTGKDFKIDLGWDGSTKFILTKYPTKDELKTLPQIQLTANIPYKPDEQVKKLKAR